MSATLEVSGLFAGYGKLEVLHGVDLQVEEGEIVCLLGPNGAGKTTTLLAAAGALRPFGGSVTLAGQALEGMRPHQVSRAGLSLIPEARGVLGGLTVKENLLLRCRHRRRADALGMLEHFPELQPLLRRRACLLSGGEQQMLAIAAVLAARPAALLIDEMSQGLAPVIISRLVPALRRHVEESGMALLVVEQHIGVARAFADRAYVMRRGEIAMSGDISKLDTTVGSLEDSYLGTAGFAQGGG